MELKDFSSSENIDFKVFGLGEGCLAQMLNYSTKACGGILPNHCYKPFLLVWFNNLI